MSLFKKIICLLVILAAVSCNNNTSVQEYFIKSKDNDKFISLNIDPNMFTNLKDLEDEVSKDILKSFEKVNVLAYRLDKTKPLTDNSEMSSI